MDGRIRHCGQAVSPQGRRRATHQIHIFAQADTGNIARHLAVRDYLRAHPEEAAAYASLKVRLAAKYPRDIEGYCDGKEAFVRALERRALAEYGK